MKKNKFERGICVNKPTELNEEELVSIDADHETVRQLFIERCEQLQMTTGDLARFAKIPYGSVYNFFYNKYSPRLNQFLRMCLVLDIKIKLKEDNYYFVITPDSRLVKRGHLIVQEHHFDALKKGKR